MKKSKFKISIFLFLLLIIVFFGYKFFIIHKNNSRKLDFSKTQKTITINDDGIPVTLLTNSISIDDIIKERKINLSENDQIIPQTNAKIFDGTNIQIYRGKKVNIEVDGEKISNFTLKKNVREILEENKVILSRLDKTEPDLAFPAQNDMRIAITRINIEEKIEKKDIDFKIVSKNDSKLSWREKKVTQKGIKGIKEIKYEITYKNGKEISRKILEKKVTQEPTDQIETQGTYMKLGKSNKGQGTWYAYKGGMFAASTTIPRGNYAKVTNTANGKSVIVQINDYGPQGKGRIIDLDKIAFQEIASLGAGVIGVKVEEVLN